MCVVREEINSVTCGILWRAVFFCFLGDVKTKCTDLISGNKRYNTILMGTQNSKYCYANFNQLLTLKNKHRMFSYWQTLWNLATTSEGTPRERRNLLRTWTFSNKNFLIKLPQSAYCTHFTRFLLFALSCFCLIYFKLSWVHGMGF